MKDLFLKKSEKMISDAYDYIKSLSSVKAGSFESSETAVIMVDIINGFINEGALHDNNIAGISPQVEKLLKYAVANDIPAVAFADCHSPSSKEFSSFPVHCLRGGAESEIVDELKNIGGYIVAEKNSTNGFHCPEFQRFLSDNPNIKNFIVCGDCTDICVMNFCLTLKTYFDQADKHCRIAVPVNMVETYDADNHYNVFMNTAAFIFMRNAGIELTGGIDFD